MQPVWGTSYGVKQQEASSSTGHGLTIHTPIDKVCIWRDTASVTTAAALGMSEQTGTVFCVVRSKALLSASQLLTS